MQESDIKVGGKYRRNFNIDKKEVWRCIDIRYNNYILANVYYIGIEGTQLAHPIRLDEFLADFSPIPMTLVEKEAQANREDPTRRRTDENLRRLFGG
jgi:hypothetical protein